MKTTRSANERKKTGKDKEEKQEAKINERKKAEKGRKLKKKSR